MMVLGEYESPFGAFKWGLGNKGPHIEPADKNFLGLCIVSNFIKWANFLLKMG